MDKTGKRLCFEVTGPDSEKIYDAIDRVQQAMHEVRVQYDSLCDELGVFALHINQRDAE